nr:MAG TPA: Integrase [Caudoviricetes sp.]
MVTYCKNRKCRAPLPEGAVYCPACGRKQITEHRRGRRANGTGTVYKIQQGNRSRPWVAVRNRILLGSYATKAEATAALELSAGRRIEETYNMLFSEVFESWKTEHYRKLSIKGQEGSDNAYKYFAPLHARKFRELRVSDFQPCVDAAINAGRSESTQKKLKQLISQMSKWAIREGVCGTSYAPFIQLTHTPPKEKPIFTDAELAKLRKDDTDSARIILMLVYTGVRINELFSATLDAYHGSYFITGSKTAAGKNRVVPIPEPARQYFESFAAKATTFLLDGYAGNRIPSNFRCREYADTLKRLNIPYRSPHNSRHTYASHAVKNKVRPEQLQKILGHADYSTTAEIYVHSDTNDLIDAGNQAWEK